jgi:hypothetical protein
VDEELPPEALLIGYPAPIIREANRLRALVRRSVPRSIERVRDGWRIIGYDLPVGRRTSFFAWVMPQNEHVHLGFPLGIALRDPERVLEGRSVTKRARWLTVRDPADFDAARFGAFVLEAAAVAALPSSERAALIADRSDAMSDGQIRATARRNAARVRTSRPPDRDARSD